MGAGSDFWFASRWSGNTEEKSITVTSRRLGHEGRRVRDDRDDRSLAQPKAHAQVDVAPEQNRRDVAICPRIAPAFSPVSHYFRHTPHFHHTIRVNCARVRVYGVFARLMLVLDRKRRVKPKKMTVMSNLQTPQILRNTYADPHLVYFDDPDQVSLDLRGRRTVLATSSDVILILVVVSFRHRSQ